MASETLEGRKLNQCNHLEEKDGAEVEKEVNETEEVGGKEVSEGKEDQEDVHATVEENDQEEVQTPEEEEQEEVQTPEEEKDSEEKSLKRNSKNDEERSAVKRRRKGTPSSTEPATPIQRPSRERKIVQRFTALAPEKVSATKGVNIQQGNGTPLKDIPNVAFKLSKRKGDENLQILHTILFGKRTKPHNLKKNIGQFSGFVWVENEEKQRTKMRERLDKYVKEKLLDFCDVLDIPVSTATKKDEILGKLLEFLESPHATTSVSLADKEQSRKNKKRRRKSSSATGSSSREKGRQIAKAKKKRNQPSESTGEAVDDETDCADSEVHSDKDEDDVTVPEETSDEEDEKSLEEDDKKIEPKQRKNRSVKSLEAGDQSIEVKGSKIRSLKLSEEEGNAKEVQGSKKRSVKKSMKHDTETEVKAQKGSPTKSEKGTESESSPAKSMETPEKSKKRPDKLTETSPNLVSKKGSATDDDVLVSRSKSKGSTTKVQKDNEMKSQKKQNASSENKKTSKKQQGNSGVTSAIEEGTTSVKPAVAELSRDDMQAAVSDILKEVDFNTATLSDILRKLETHFKMSLTHRKSEVKSIIEEVISNMTDEEDAGEDADNGSEEEAD